MDKRVRTRVSEIARTIVTLDFDRPSLQPSLQAIHDLAEIDHVTMYSLRNRTGRWAVERMDCSAGMNELEHRTRAMFERAPEFPLHYNPMTPVSEQRNKVIDGLEWVEQREPPGTWERHPMYTEILAPLRKQHYRHPRVLLCDGVSLLAWFGGLTDGKVTPRQRKILGTLAGPMRRRLMAERALFDGPVVRDALDVMLEREGRPAFLIDARGTVHQTNTYGSQLLRDEHDLGRDLRDALAGRPARYEFTFIQLASRGLSKHWIAVLRIERAEARIAACVAAVSQLWNLTPRQREVLALVSRGLANSTISAMLGCVERTVELHITALLDRAGVDSRAALVSTVLTAI